MNGLALQQRPTFRIRELALFAGAGGGILGGKLLGWEIVGGVEINTYCARRLMQRQNEGHLPPFPVWDDVCTFDGRSWRGRVEVVSGGFPCTDISVAGKGAGLDGAESKLWSEQARIIGEVRPCFAFVENSPALTFRGGLRVVADLAAMGYDCRWGVMGAEDAIWSFGTPCLDHERARIWILATRNSATGDGDGDGDGLEAGELRSGRQPQIALSGKSDIPASDAACERLQVRGRQPSNSTSANANPESERCGKTRGVRHGESQEWTSGRNQTVDDTNGNGCGQVEQEVAGGAPIEGQLRAPAESIEGWWATEPDVDRVVHGLANRVDRLRAVGMGQVPAVVELAWKTLIGLKP